MRSAFGVLAKLKGLRGGALDVFGRTEERRMERALITRYEATITELLKTLNAANRAQAVEIARLPEDIRGFGHVKLRHWKAVEPRWDTLMKRWREGPLAAEAAKAA
jgi:indolepyruvate ferredoxin oxidoreductase